MQSHKKPFIGLQHNVSLGGTKEKMYYILLERVLIDKVFWFRNVMLTSMILYLGTVFWCVCWCDTSCACGVLVGDHMVLSRVCSGATRCVDVPATRYRWSVATQTPTKPPPDTVTRIP